MAMGIDPKFDYTPTIQQAIDAATWPVQAVSWDQVWYPDEEAVSKYGAQPDDYYPLVVLDPVPCELCGDECKPGEDQCWGCLGEEIPKDEMHWYVFGHDKIQSSTFINQVYTVPQASGTNQHIFTATSSLMITGVQIQGNSWTINPAINVVSGDQINFQFTGMIT